MSGVKNIDYSDMLRQYKDSVLTNKTKFVRDYCSDNNIKVSFKEMENLRRNFSKHCQRSEVIINGLGGLPKNTAKILIFDLETSPLESYIWSLWNQNIGHNLDMLKSDWFILTWSAKWLFEDDVMSDKLTKKEALDQNDSRIVKNLWKLMDEADIIIAHNALKFDVKKMNSRFILNGLNPPSNYEVIDTLVHARKKFAMSSNKLDYLADILGVGRKVQHEGFNLWKKCKQGDEEALLEMSRYNDGDVTLLEEVYLKLRPWIKPHPNIGLYAENDIQVCPSCGSDNLKWGGIYRTYVNEYTTCRCGNCGAESRSRKAIMTESRKHNLLVSIPR